MKNLAKNVPVGRNTGRKTQKGNSTPKAKKTRSTPRFYDVKIRLTADEYARGQPYFDSLKYLPKFFIDAHAEKVNRAESNSKSARLRTLMGNMDLLEPVLKEMHAQGKLNFLSNSIGGENGV
jgi:hypothetical protein